MRQLFQQSRHVYSYGRKHLRIFESKPQRAIPAHGDPADRPACTAAGKPETPLHLRHKLANKKVLVENVAVARINVKAILALRRDDHKLAQPFVFPGFLDPARRPARSQKALITAESMQKIQHRKTLARMRVVAGR